MKADILKKLRSKHKITQGKLADEIGVSRSLIGMIESGKQEGSIEIVKKVAKYFDVSVDYLEGLKEESNKNEREKLVSNFLSFLVESGVVTDTDNIDKKTKEMIFDMVKKELENLKRGK